MQQSQLHVPARTRRRERKFHSSRPLRKKCHDNSALACSSCPYEPCSTPADPSRCCRHTVDEPSREQGGQSQSDRQRRRYVGLAFNRKLGQPSRTAPTSPPREPYDHCFGCKSPRLSVYSRSLFHRDDQGRTCNLPESLPEVCRSASNKSSWDQ